MIARENWPQIIEELEKAGWSVYKIATRLNCRYIQIQRIRDGGRVSFELGTALLALHGEVTIVPRSPAISMRSA